MIYTEQIISVTSICCISAKFTDVYDDLCSNAFNCLFSENYDLNQSFAIITDSSSEDDLPQLSSSGIRNTQQTRNTNAGESEDDDTLPLTTQVTFYYKHAVIKESFPNNSKGHVRNLNTITSDFGHRLG